MSNAPRPIVTNNSSAEDAQLHDLLPFTIQDRVFGVLTEQVDATAEAKPFARLPRAPRAVVGVACVRGRMVTVLDVAVILNHPTREWEQALPYVLVLRGDDQLGLAAETCRDTITISAEDIERPAEDSVSPDDPVLGVVRYSGEEILLFDANRLLNRAIQRRERRRRRF